MDNIKLIESEIQTGLQNERDRLEEARENYAYYNGCFDEYESKKWTRWDRYDDKRSERQTLFLNWVTHTLTSYLYRNSPTRSIKDSPAATEFLHKVYKDNSMSALFQSADRLSLVGDFAAFQVAGGDDENPIKISLWDSQSIVVWTCDYDPTEPEAVCTIDAYDNKRRYHLWTKDLHNVYETDKQTPGQTAGGRTSRLVLSEANPYGVLPFSFVHFDFPTTCFYSKGPGTILRKANAYLNYRLSELGDTIRYLGKPMLIGKNLDPNWHPPKPLMPGEILEPRARANPDLEGNALEAKLEYLQNNPNYVDAEWKDMENFRDFTLECSHIPPAAFRMVQSGARSGISIISEQLPIISWSQTRQLPFSHYEACLAKLVLQVASQHFLNNNRQSEASPLLEALQDFELTIRWGDMSPNLPGPDRDAADQWLLDKGLTSKVELLERRYGFTRDEAISHLQLTYENQSIEETYNKASKQIFQYHIENNITSRNEVREYLGLPAEKDSPDEENSELLNKLKLVKAATDAGLPLDYACTLAGLPAPPTPPPAPPEEIETVLETDQEEVPTELQQDVLGDEGATITVEEETTDED